MLETIKSALDVIFPDSCAGCGKNGKTFCKECKDKIRIVDPEFSCPLCGRSVGKKIVCGECLEQKRNYFAGFFLYYYTEPIRRAIHFFKFERRIRIGRILVRIAEERIRNFTGQFDYLLPVPVTEKRLKERGFNQAYTIAEEISRITAIPVLPHVLLKVKETKDQYTLDKSERRKNIKDAFAIMDKRPIRDKRILLVDDLFTTGYTLMEASKVVQLAEPSSVSVFALARAL